MKGQLCWMCLLGTLVVGGTAYGQISGAIFTTDKNCDGTDLNIYTSKSQVYLDGGPRKEGAAGLPDGEYYVKVTEPNGTLLGTSIGADDETPVLVVNGKFFTCYKLCNIVIKASNHKPGYDTTSNSGGEYKVWVSQDSAFTNSLSKTDNFKVAGGNATVTEIHVRKFYDLDGDGMQGDPAHEPSIPNWHIELKLEDGTVVGCQLTDGGGDAEFLVSADGTNYLVEETLVAPYVNTTPLVVPVTATSGTPEHNVVFGNVCLAPVTGLGRTPGFWQSCNNDKGAGVVGCDLLENCDPQWRALLNGLCLANPDGTGLEIPGGDFEVAFDALDGWITGNGAEGNMAYILSRQLAAIALNRECGFLKDSPVVYISCGDEMLDLDDVIADAASLLCDYPYTVGSSQDPEIIAARAEQEALKDCIDDVNNNITPVWVVSPTPCPFEIVECP